MSEPFERIRAALNRTTATRAPEGSNESKSQLPVIAISTENLEMLLGSGKPKDPATVPEVEVLLPLLAVIGGLTFVVLTMEAVGYVAAMFVFYLVLVVLLGTRAPLAIIAVTLLGSFGTSTVFTRYLKQALPLGSWWM